MPIRIIFKGNRIQGADRSVVAEPGTSLLDVAREHRIPMGEACGGVCACSTCHCYVLGGQEALEPAEDQESDRLDQAFDVRFESRLGCQAHLRSAPAVDAVVIQVSEEGLQAYVNENPELKS